MKFDTVLVIGLGGTGSNVMPPLVRLLLSCKFTGNILLADGDSYSESNIDRQIFALEAGMNVNKAEYQAMIIQNHIPQLSEQIGVIDKYLSKEDIDEVVTEKTLVINCADNLAIRKYVEDKVRSLNNAAHICCGNELKVGQVQLSLRKNGEDITPSIYQHSPEFNKDNDDRAKMDCLQLSQLPGGGQLICANFMAAALAINMVYWLMGEDKFYLDCAYIPVGTTAFNCTTNVIKNLDQFDRTPDLVNRYKKILQHA